MGNLGLSLALMEDVEMKASLALTIACWLLMTTADCPASPVYLYCVDWDAPDEYVVDRYNVSTGTYVDRFTSLVESAEEMQFGPDGNLYTARASVAMGAGVQCYDGTTGQHVGAIGPANAFALLPEPATLGLLGLGAMAIIRRGRRRP